MRPTSITWPAPAVAAVAAPQTLGAAGSLTINGSLLDQSYMPYQTIANFGKGIERTASLTSTGNLSGINFTITGLTYNDVVVTETIAGPNNNTVYTTALFNRITSITANAAVATAVSVGSGTTGNTDLVIPDNMLGNAMVGLAVIVTAGTINVTVQYTTDDPFGATAPTVFFDHPTLASITASQSDDGAAFPTRGWRMKVNSSTDGAAIFRVDQAGGIS